MRAIKKVAVIGGGTMGADLAALMLQKRKAVIVKEVNKELADKVKDRLNQRIESWKQKGRIGEMDAETMKLLLTVTDNFQDLQEEGLLVIEAVPEKIELKQQIFAELEQNLPKDAMLASNTSSLPITLLTELMQDKNRLVGMHFFNPPTKMPLVEIILSKYSSEETVSSVENFAKRTLQKKTIRVKDCAGFLVNRLLLPYLNEAARLLTESALTPEEIDEEAKKFGWPMGPFVLMDFLGIDVCAEVAKFMETSYGPRAEPAPILSVLVKLKRFGQKSGGVGFYGGESLMEILNGEFPERGKKTVSAEEGFRRMMLGMVNEAFHCLEENVSSAEDIETGSLYGIGFPMARQGVLHWAEKENLLKVIESLTDCALRCGSRFEPASYLAKCVIEGKTIFEDNDLI